MQQAGMNLRFLAAQAILQCLQLLSGLFFFNGAWGCAFQHMHTFHDIRQRGHLLGGLFDASRGSAEVGGQQHVA